MTIVSTTISLSGMKTPTTANTSAEAPNSRRAVAAASVGNAIEWYDFAVYGALASIVTPLFFPQQSSSSTLFAAFAVFATAFVARPFGALVLGRRADARGRRTVMIAVIVTMSAATAGIGVLPTYATIGLLAPLCLVLLRVGQGFAAGGELGVATAFVVEHSAHGRRGATSAWQVATLAAGVALGFLVASATSIVGADNGSNGGWRVAFLLAIPLALIGLYIRQRVDEPPGFALLRREHQTVPDSASQVWVHHRSALKAGFALIAAGSIGFNVFFVFVPNRLITVEDRSLPAALLPAVAGLLVTAGSSLVLGRASDRLGRRPVVLTSAAVLALVAVPMYLLADKGDTLGLILADSAVGVCVGGVLSVSMVAEMFSTPVRAAGVAMTAGLATALFGGTAPLVSQALVVFTDLDAAPGIYLAVAAIVALLAIRSWPESAFETLV